MILIWRLYKINLKSMLIIKYMIQEINMFCAFSNVFFATDLAEPVFSYSDTVVSLTWNESLHWTQDGFFDDFRVSYSTVMNGSRREEYFVTNDTFVALWKLNVEIGPTYTFVVCARKGVQCAAYSTNLYFRGKTLRLLSCTLTSFKTVCKYSSRFHLTWIHEIFISKYFAKQHLKEIVFIT